MEFVLNGKSLENPPKGQGLTRGYGRASSCQKCCLPRNLSPEFEKQLSRSNPPFCGVSEDSLAG